MLYRSVQSARAVVFLGPSHGQLWDLGDAALKRLLPPPAYEKLAPKVAQFKEGYGTVAFFEDQVPLKEMGEKNPSVAGMMGQWSEHASGMAQFVGEFVRPLLCCIKAICTDFINVVWTALSLEGLGCSMQHYNFDPSFTADIKKTWGLPESWDLKSQLVFGAPVKDGFVRDRERTYLPIEPRVRIVSN